MEKSRKISMRDKIRKMSTKEKPPAPAAEAKDASGGAWFFALLVVYVLFLVLGAAIFRALEFEVEVTHEVVDEPRWAQIKEAVMNSSSTGQENLQHLAWLELTCPRTNVTLLDGIFSEDPAGHIELLEEDCKELRSENESDHLVYSWSFIDALYFSMTVTTTIGYGHIAPSRPWGKVACMLYAIVGVPLTGILLAKTSDFFGEKIFEVYRSKLSGDKQRSQVFIVWATIIYLALGFVIFIFLPAAAFSYMEDWSYLDGVYFAFITLTTIGLGDLVTGRNMDEGATLVSYQIVVIIWIITSLGYWVMVANFISRALRSKKLHNSLLNRAKLLKEMMASQGHSEPVFVPQRSKNSLNFMLQLSSMLPVPQENMNQQLDLQEALDAAGHGELASRRNSTSSMGGPLGIPGIASLFNFQNGLSATSLNKKICESLAKRRLHGKWLTGDVDKPGTHKTLSSPGRLCLMGGCLTCATLLLGSPGTMLPTTSPSILNKVKYWHSHDLQPREHSDDPAAALV